MSETPGTLDREQIVESSWRDQGTWSEAASHLKAELTAWRFRAAVAAVVGAFFQTLAAALSGWDEGRWVRAFIALAGAVILAVVPYVVRVKASKDRVKEWVRARSAAEGLKETIYRYLVGAAPFGPESSPADLIKRRQAIKEKVQDLTVVAASIEPPRKERPLTLTPDGYVENRVNEPIERYYRPKGRERALAAERLRTLEFYIGLLAVVMGAMASAAVATGLPQLAGLGPWVAVVTTAGAAVTAHLAASRYDHEAIIYFGTADRLAALRDEWLANPNRLDPPCVANFVNECENAISTETEAWLAAWTREQADT